MKMAAILEEVARRPNVQIRLIHTCQHYSADMSDAFFQDLQMRAPDVMLHVGSGSHTEQTARVMQTLEPELTQHRPDLLIVVGDVNSTMAATLTAAKMYIPVAHVEAGLRSFDREMPEEVNRIVTDHLSDYLFATSAYAIKNLAAEGIPREKIYFVGNVMIDTLLRFRPASERTTVLERFGLEPKGYVLVTLHRPASVDDPDRLASLWRILAEISQNVPVVFPMHPRTRARLEGLGMFNGTANGAGGNLLLTPPLGYLEFLRLTGAARLVLTDSGGVQEETTVLQVPCLTVRKNTERPITVTSGTNTLVGLDANDILKAVLERLTGPTQPAQVPALWDGKASARILDVLEAAFRK